jgi:hypothetical protein
MTDNTPLSDLLNWKLLPGSHDSPGPDGGTCINEAAIIAAGYKYRKVEELNDCPPCFSRPIAQYAIDLNDNMPDDLRQSLLMPFVTRLAGTADNDVVEIKRAKHMVVETVRRVLPLVMTQRQEFVKHRLVRQCQRAKTLYAAHWIARVTQRIVFNYIIKDTHEDNDTKVLLFIDKAASYINEAATNADIAKTTKAASVAAEFAAAAVAVIAKATANKTAVWREAVAILDEAIALGNQPEPLDTVLVVHRMSQAREAQ